MTTVVDRQCAEAKRQLAVGALADDGLTINEIARELVLPPQRVRTDMALMGFDTGVCNDGHPYREKRTRERGAQAKDRGCRICKALQTRKPCSRCGGPKPAGKRRSLCDRCRS